MAVLILVTAQSGIGKTVAVYQSPEAPILLMISDLPFNESVRHFHRLSLFKFDYAVIPICMFDVRGAKIHTEYFKLASGSSDINRSG